MRALPKLLRNVAKENEYKILALMLVCLHLAIWWDFSSALARSLMLAHFGLFLLWQPIWDRDRRLGVIRSSFFVVAAVTFVLSASWLLTSFWTLLLTGLVAGRATRSDRARRVYLAAVALLVTELLVRCVPETAQLRALPEVVRQPFGYMLLAVEASLWLLPTSQSVKQHKSVSNNEEPNWASQLSQSKSDRPELLRAGNTEIDFIYALGVALLGLLLSLGTVTVHFVADTDYLNALVFTLLGIAAFLMAISWLWMPVAGFSGLGQLWDRYVENLGTPLELWLYQLQRDAAVDGTADEFLRRALTRLSLLDWVVGVEYRRRRHNLTQDASDSQSFDRFFRGERSSFSVSMRMGNSDVTVYAQRRVGPALSIHGTLILRLIRHFHAARLREQELTRRAHLEAIHETGARVTHDIKNLLQTLKAMSAATAQSKPEDAAELQALLQNQLPMLTQRLQLALDKLQAPAAEKSRQTSVKSWWRDLKARYAGFDIEFDERIEHDAEIPLDLFDTVAENLLDNARFKRLNEPAIHIQIIIQSTASRISLIVRDDGSRIEADTAERLFESVVDSPSGLGIGLYQAHQLAQRHAYTLNLVENNKSVAFELGSASANHSRANH